MYSRKTVPLSVAALLIAMLCGVAFSQTTKPANPGQPLSDEEMKALIEKSRQQTDKFNREALGATNDEWKVLGPKFDKVVELQQQIRYAGSVQYKVDGTVDENAAKTDVQKAAAGLLKIAKNKDAKPEDLKDALQAFRRAKTKAAEDLEKARKDLKELLTVRQEATLLLKGILE